MSSPTPSPSPGPSSSPTPTPTPTPSPSPGPSPIPPAALSVKLPTDVPANVYQLLSQLADDIDTLNGHFSTAADSLSGVQKTTNGAVSNVTTHSQGKTTSALATIWDSALTDLNGAYNPLSTVITSSYMGGSPNPLRAVLDENQAAIQAGVPAMETLRALQNSCPATPPTEQEVEGWIQQVNGLVGALGNVSMAIDAMAMAIRGLNSGFAAVCATGLTPGGSLPVFHQNSFANEMHTSSTGGSSSGGPAGDPPAGWLKVPPDDDPLGIPNSETTPEVFENDGLEASLYPDGELQIPWIDRLGQLLNLRPLLNWLGDGVTSIKAYATDNFAQQYFSTDAQTQQTMQRLNNIAASAGFKGVVERDGSRIWLIFTRIGK